MKTQSHLISPTTLLARLTRSLRRYWAGLWLAAGCLLLNPVDAAETRDGRMTLSLDGTWQFATDPDEVGEREQWFAPGRTLPTMPRPGYARTARGRVRVPGAWDAQGYGTETDKLRHQFNGRGWYRREIRIPRHWDGRRLFLQIGGVMRSAKAWVNGTFLGEHVGYISAHEYDITRFVTPGQTGCVVLSVDSRWDLGRDPLMGCGPFMDYMGSGCGQSAGYQSTSEATWGGIWGHVSLEACQRLWLDQLHVEPEIVPPSCAVSAQLHGQAEPGDRLHVEVHDRAQSVLVREFELAQVLTAGRVQIPATHLGPIPDAKLWSFRHPNLYTVTVSLRRNQLVLDQVQTRTGLRELRVDGMHFRLNGQRIFLTGYGDDAIYPVTSAWPSDIGFYRERLRQIKAYGFNYVRHHSHMLPDEYYDACDELGMLVQVEAPIFPARHGGGTVTFVFAGGLGYLSQPDAGGFTLAIDGQPVLDFDVTLDSRVWSTPDRRASLRFEVKRRLDQDSVGFFYLTVPTDRLTAGRALELRVNAKGAGSRRWFALHPYTDLVDD